MNTKEVIEAIRNIMAEHKGAERELYEALVDEASGWKMRLEEIEQEEDES